MRSPNAPVKPDFAAPGARGEDRGDHAHLDRSLLGYSWAACSRDWMTSGRGLKVGRSRTTALTARRRGAGRACPQAGTCSGTAGRQGPERPSGRGRRLEPARSAPTAGGRWLMRGHGGCRPRRRWPKCLGDASRDSRVDAHEEFVLDVSEGAGDIYFREEIRQPPSMGACSRVDRIRPASTRTLFARSMTTVPAPMVRSRSALGSTSHSAATVSRPVEGNGVLVGERNQEQRRGPLVAEARRAHAPSGPRPGSPASPHDPAPHASTSFSGP